MPQIERNGGTRVYSTSCINVTILIGSLVSIFWVIEDLCEVLLFIFSKQGNPDLGDA